MKFLTDPVVLIVLLVALLYVASIFNKRRNDKRFKARKEQAAIDSRDVVRKDFPTIDEVGFGKRWIGKGATIEKWMFAGDDGRGDEFSWTLLCRTAKGAWFIVEYTIFRLNIEKRVISIGDEESAKELLSSDIEKYTAIFGEPEIA